MPFIKKYNADFFIKDNKIVLSDEYVKNNKFKFKKITGTKFGAVLGLNQYTSPVKVWTTIVGIYKEEIDPIYAKAGTMIEPLVRDFTAKNLNLDFTCYDPVKIKWDVFAENKIFGGIPDGEPIDKNGKLIYDQNKPMLEVKTSSFDKFDFVNVDNNMRVKLDSNGIPIVKEKLAKYKTWFNEDNKIQIPEEYICQLSLYLTLRHADKGLFAITFLTPEDYAHPENYKPEEHEIHIVEMNLKNHDKINEQMEYASNWYNKYVLNGNSSPELSNLDLMWLKKELKI